MSDVTVEFDEDIATITLRRPDHLNALTLASLHQLRDAALLVASSDARAVVLCGEGASFCAGIDLATFKELASSDPEQRYDGAALGGEVAAAIESMPQPSVAALHGNVVGGGVVLAAASDFRIADADTVFSIPEIDLGIPLAWGGLPRLVREIGPMRAKELVMTGRPFSADEAFGHGLVTAVAPPGEALGAATDLAERLADKAKFPIATMKRHVAEIAAHDDSRDDTLGLVAALEDPEAAQHRVAYIRSFE